MAVRLYGPGRWIARRLHLWRIGTMMRTTRVVSEFSRAGAGRRIDVGAPATSLSLAPLDGLAPIEGVSGSLAARGHVYSHTELLAVAH